ncbi:MAG: hypothetical protein COA88_12090 [Kordia sp.]|nr:MAG: hypothetical protein COA88_12090 [Kordia sp.]
MNFSLVISTYNWTEALELVLKSVLEQTELPIEVLIADDGSTSETKTLVESFRANFPIAIKHIWHEDNGFKKAIILNKAIAEAKGEYIIQVDGDCILHVNFIEDHIKKAEKGVYLYGSRVNIKRSYLQVLFKNKQTEFNCSSKGIKKRTRAIHNTFLSNKYKPLPSFSKKYRGCNTSFYKEDFIAVNGYNEEFKGWGREDSELALRFHNYGLLAKRLRYNGIVYHIWHEELSKSNLGVNNEIEKDTIDNNRRWTINGVDKYLKNLHKLIKNEDVCIVIPIYKTDLTDIEKQSLKQCVKVLNNYDIYFVEPEKMDSSIINVGKQIKIKKFSNNYFDGILGYNKLLLSEGFYSSFNSYEYMLIYQLDCFVFNDELLKWCNKGFDYIGAPWISSKQTLLKTFLTFFDNSKKKRRSKIFYKVGNGGFSLRRIHKFINITQNNKAAIANELKRDSDDFKLMEDVFWSFKAAQLDTSFKIPDYRVALKFAIDRKPKIALKLNYNKLPFGCHGINKPKVINFWKKIIPELKG